MTALADDKDATEIAAGSPTNLAGFEAFAPLKGNVDLHGYHTLAGGWFFAGWVTTCPDIAERFENVTAVFADKTVSGLVSSLFFMREDVGDGAVGFLIFLPAGLPLAKGFRFLSLEVDGVAQSIHPATNAEPLTESKMVPRLNFISSLSEHGPRRREIELLLNGQADDAGTGYIEYFGYHAAAGGWFISGWVSRVWAEDQTPDRLVVSFDEGEVRGEIAAAFFVRAELPEGARGVVFFVRAPLAALGQINALRLHAAGMRTFMKPIAAVPQLRETELTARLKSNLAQVKPGLFRDRLTNILTRRPYTGEDTLDAMAPSVCLCVDEAIQCGAEGLVLVGWMLTKPGDVREIRVRCGGRVSVLQPGDFVKIERHDVIAEFAKHGYDDASCGFIAYLPAALEPDAKPYVEVETHRYETGFRNFKRPARSGMAAIKQLLGAVEVRFGDIVPAFDKVLGPAVEALNRERLMTPVGCQVVEYGNMPKAPKYSVIVPLHGRLDFVEYQLALFSARPEFASVEFIFVLDDPPKRREAQILFNSIHERFLIPFRAVLLERNVGFAPANNVGLRHAQGEFIAYLNSDVFPGTLDWLEQLSARLDADPGLGAVGPLLLFEDGSVQHRGMYFERLAEYGNWFFCQHFDKGMRYTSGSDLQHFLSITGACMVLRRELAEQIGGFDETYVIGDFEDSDMCLKLRSMGYACAVDPQVRLYHLERKSQLTGALTWRANLTAYNAWQHERRWGNTIASAQSLVGADQA